MNRLIPKKIIVVVDVDTLTVLQPQTIALLLGLSMKLDIGLVRVNMIQAHLLFVTTIMDLIQVKYVEIFLKLLIMLTI